MLHYVPPCPVPSLSNHKQLLDREAGKQLEDSCIYQDFLERPDQFKFAYHEASDIVWREIYPKQ